MSSHALIQTALMSFPGLVALVGQRIRPDLARPEDDFPFVVFKRAALVRHKGLDGTVHGTTETFEIECWGSHRSQSVDVSEQALLALDAAHLDASDAGPDGVDPDQLDRVTVLTVEI
ncbi:DUF3168 domain-containing protein [Nostoc sp. NIES-2111]